MKTWDILIISVCFVLVTFFIADCSKVTSTSASDMQELATLKNKMWTDQGYHWDAFKGWVKNEK